MLTMNLRRLAMLPAPLALFAAGGIAAAGMTAPPRANLDPSLTQITHGGHYVVSLRPDHDPVPVGKMHAWTIKVTGSDGRGVDAASIVVDGGMPHHGHGLPTRPQVTGQIGNGQYRLEGMKFNMPGRWTLHITVDAAAGKDSATFKLGL